MVNSTAHRILLGGGLIGAVVFPLTYLVDGALRPGYNGLTEPISALALGPPAWVQISNFIVYGVLTMLSAVGWRAALVPGRGSAAFPTLKLITGVALVLTGIFHAGPRHDIVSYVSLIATVVGLFVIAFRLHHEPSWRGWAIYAVVTAVLMMGFLAGFGALVAHGSGGVFEKLATITAACFTILLTARVLARGCQL